MRTRTTAARAALLLTVLTAGCATSGLPDEPVLKNYELKQRVFPLKSGLRVVVQEDHSAPRVVITSAYGVGSTSDPKGVEGLAHFVEHLAFRSRPGGGPQFWDVLTRLGAAKNAFTTTDVTAYYATAHKDRLAELMQLEAWRLARTLDGVTPEVFATEREVVRNELRQRGETTIGSRLGDLVMTSLYPPGHPLHRSTVGTHESLTAATLEHAQAFVKKHYRPENCSIVIAGDVDADEVQKLLGLWPAELLFGPGGPEGPAVEPAKRLGERPLVAVPTPVSTALTRHKGPVVQPELVLAWSLPPAYRGDDALMEFTATRLNVALALGLEIDEDDDIESVGAGLWPGADGSALLVFAELKPGADAEKARTRILDAVVNAWTMEYGREVTEGTRWRGATSRLLAAGDPVDLATDLAVHMAATGKSAFFKEHLEALAKVETNGVTELAYKWLKRERAVAVYFEPETEQRARIVAGGGGAGRERAGTHDLGRGPAVAVGGLGAEQILAVARSPGFGKLPHWKLANGLELWAVRYGSAPVAQVALSIAGGDASTRPYGLASYAMGFSRQTCSDHGSLLTVGGFTGGFVGTTHSRLRAEVLSGNLANALAVVSDRLRCIEADEEEFLHREQLLKSWVRRHERQEKRPEYVAEKRLRAELYPEHPYGTADIDPRTMQAVSFAEVSGFVRSLYRPEGAVMVVVGDVEPEDVRKLADRYLATWQPTGGVAPAPIAPPAAAPTRRKVFLVDRPGATQATVDVACRLPAATPDTYPVYDLIEGMLNERSWSLREEWGATYGVHAGVAVRPGAAELGLSGAVENKQAGRAVGRLLDLVGELASPQLDENLFLTKRWDAAAEFSWRFSSASSMASAIHIAAQHRWPVEMWDRYPARLAALQPQNVRDTVAGCVGKEIVTVTGDATVLRPQLAEAGLKLEDN